MATPPLAPDTRLLLLAAADTRLLLAREVSGGQFLCSVISVLTNFYQLGSAAYTFLV